VWRIVVNTARTQAKARELPVAELEPSTNGSSSNDDAPVGLVRLLSLLPERQRTVVFLRYFGDLDYRSIAEVMDVKVGTVSASLNAAHLRLRGLMKEVR
jgi:RNA polymerase sigma factor (sigma-70 family)